MSAVRVCSVAVRAVGLAPAAQKALCIQPSANRSSLPRTRLTLARKVEQGWELLLIRHPRALTTQLVKERVHHSFDCA